MTPRMIRWLPRSRRCAVCGKVRYATREAAAGVVAKASGRHRVTCAYYTPRCGGWWHLTSRQESAAPPKPLETAVKGLPL